MIEKNLHELINQYEQDMFDNKDADEGNRHIWEAVRHFQDTWFSDNASSMTFTDLFGESIEDNSMYLNSHILSPLTRVTRSINNRHLSPVTGILKMAQQCPEKVENLFRNILFADYCSISELQEHVNIFLEETEALRKMYFPAFYKYKQNRYAASCYLTFFAPEKHYIYCYREAKEFAEYINYKNAELKSGLLGLEEYYELADIIVKALKEHPSLIEKYNTFFENNNKYYFDKSLHLLAIDLMYCSRWHNYYIVLESARRI